MPLSRSNNNNDKSKKTLIEDSSCKKNEELAEIINVCKYLIGDSSFYMNSIESAKKIFKELSSEKIKRNIDKLLERKDTIDQKLKIINEIE